MASQEERKAETRRRLLDAAAALFAARGIEGVSIDAVADAADRTSGAVYAHFGGKEGLLAALLDTLTNETAAVITAEQTAATDTDQKLAALWRTFADPPSTRDWMLLEHELWLYACRHPEARPRAAARFAQGRRRVAASIARWRDEDGAQPPAPPEQVAALLVALLAGLEMQHHLDPDAIRPETAVAGLRAIAGLPALDRAPDRPLASTATPSGDHHAY
jgi:AcrR family transcriptional regulator